MYCKHCGKQIADDSIFCRYCGGKVNDEEETITEKEQVETTIQKPKVEENVIKSQPKSKTINKNLIKKIVCLSLAILLLMGCFLPIMEINDFRGLSVKTRYSSIDVLTLLGDSFKDYNTQVEDPLYDKYLELEDKMGELDSNRLSSEDKQDIEDYVKIFLRLNTRQKSFSYSYNFILCIILTILYICYAITLLVCSIISLAKEFSSKKETNKVDKLITILLLLGPAILLLVYAVYMAFFGINPQIGVMPIINITLIMLSFISLGIYNVIKNKEKFSTRMIVGRSIAVVLCIVLIGLTFSTFIETNVKTFYEQRIREITITDDCSYFNHLILDEHYYGFLTDLVYKADGNHAKKVIEDQIKMFNYCSLHDIELGYADPNNYLVVNEIIALGDLHKMRALFVCASLFILMIIILETLYMMLNLYAFSNNRTSTKSEKIMRILIFVLGVLILALMITFVCINNYNAQVLYITQYKLSVGSGLIAFVVVSFISLFVPIKNKFKKEVLYGSELDPFMEVTNDVDNEVEVTTEDENDGVELISEVDIESEVSIEEQNKSI